jgi:C4-dicarboxylate-specific signal transduction histidine kinase
MELLKKYRAAKLSKPSTQSPVIDRPHESITVRSQIHLVLRIGLTVSFCEVLVVMGIYLLPDLQTDVRIFLDAGIMILLLSPVLYFAVIRPMARHISEQKRSEERLKRHGNQLEELVNQRTSELSEANQTLKQQIRVRTAAENLMQERTFELDDYIRELQCLYAISRLMEKPDISIKQLVTKTIGLIPFAWLTPERIGVKATLDNREFKTENFKETEWKQNGKIMAHGRCIGLLEVVYLAEVPEISSEAFPKREKNLIDAISERLGGILERIETAEKLKQELTVNAALSDLYKPLIAPSASIEDMANTVLDKAKSLTKSRHGYITSIDPLKGGDVALNFTDLPKDQCGVAFNKKVAFPQLNNENSHGLWRYSLNSQDPFFTNSPQEHPATAGIPEGHIPIQRFLSVPIILGKKLVGQIALANKDQDYTEQDLDAIQRIAEFYALAFQRNEVEKALQRSKNELELRVEKRTAEIALANKTLRGEIDERKLAEKQLQENKTMLQAVFDGIADPLILVDRSMVIKMMNRAAAEYFKIAENQIAIGKVCWEATGKSGFCKDCEIPSAVLNNQIHSFERKSLRAPDRIERVFIYPVKEKKRNVGDAIVHVTDITEERRIEKQLIQSEKMASLGILVTSIAHEINNPNSFVAFNIPILGEYVEALMPFADEYAAKNPDMELFNMSYPEFRADVTKLLKNIEHGSDRISSFVSNLREFAQFDGRKPKKWVDLNSVIEKVLSICGSNIKKQIKFFDMQIPADFQTIFTDPNILEQVLLNLLVNASQAADKKKSWVKLSATSGDNWRDHTIIEVSDNGCGMEEDTKRHIFNPFFTTKSPADGTGLGLYVCHNLIQSIGGYIEVESEPGKGSTFRVILPDKDYRKEPR